MRPYKRPSMALSVVVMLVALAAGLREAGAAAVEVCEDAKYKVRALCGSSSCAY